MLKNSLNLGGRILICTLFVAVSLAAAADWTFICDTDNCDTYLLQEEDGWYMEIPGAGVAPGFMVAPSHAAVED
ncbi:MAG: hypothetical protein OXE92_03465 [Bacteroidetes bacterium]|nr:hypothetical protein [Bacteroidota bacterium]